MWGGHSEGGDHNVSGFGSPGGFLQSQGGQGDKQGARTRVQTIIPVNLAQIASAQLEGETFFLHGVDLHQVTVVGKIVSAKEAQTRYDYELDDRTGVVMDVRQFVDHDENNADTDKTPMMSINSYVRVFGHLRAFGGKRSIVAFRLQPVEDMNEVTTHILEVLKTGLYLNKRANKQSQPAGGQGQQMDTTSNTSNTTMASHGNSIHEQVHALIRGCQEMQGITIQAICSQLRGLPEKAVRDAVEFLSGEGHIYSTVDEDHFKTTD